MSYNEMQDYVQIREFHNPLITYSYVMPNSTQYCFVEFPLKASLFIKPFKEALDTWDFKLNLSFQKLNPFTGYVAQEEGYRKVNITIESYGELITLHKCFPVSSRQVKTPDHIHSILIVDGFINATNYRYQRADYQNQKITTYDIDFLQDYQSDHYKRRLISE